MSFLSRAFQRLCIFLFSAGVLWFIVVHVFSRLDQRLPLFIALIVTYIISAYIILPQIIHFILMVLRRGRIPRVSHAADGLPADPVNMVLVGTSQDLSAAFFAAGWTKADRLTLKTGWKMIRSFIFNTSYPQAPFSSLYLFGRRQDFGFQEAIGNSPRKRNHIRFWATTIDPEMEMGNLQYWLKKHRVNSTIPHIWIGAASKDTGFGLAQLTYQISHRIDKQVDKEREYIFTMLKSGGSIYDEKYISAGEQINGGYVSDGRILWAKLRSRV